MKVGDCVKCVCKPDCPLNGAWRPIVRQESDRFVIIIHETYGELHAQENELIVRTKLYEALT